MKTVHWAMIAAAAYLYYVTSQRKNVSIIPGFDPGSGPTTGPNAWDNKKAYDEGFVAPDFPHTPTPPWARPVLGSAYETGTNWPTRDYIFG